MPYFPYPTFRCRPFFCIALLLCLAVELNIQKNLIKLKIKQEKGVWLYQRTMVQLQHNEKEADYCAESSGGCQSAANSAGMECRLLLLGTVGLGERKKATF